MITDPPFVIDGRAGTGMYPHWTVADYEHAVALVITRILNWASGRAIVQGLRHRVRVIPFHNGAPNVCDARTNVLPPRTVERVGRALRAGQTVPTRQGTVVGLGSGAPSEIRYTPGHFSHGNALYCNPDGAGIAPEEVLVHEVVHATVNSAGVQDLAPLPAGGPLGFQSRGEYYAVIITNVFSSETRRTLRGEYPGFGAMQHPERFYADPGHAAMVRQICTDLPVLTSRLAGIGCSFNPFREFYREQLGLAPSSARALSEAGPGH